MERACTKCLKAKPETEFHWIVRGKRLHSHCKQCQAKTGRDQYNFKTKRYINRQKRYGLTDGQYQEMASKQNHCCAICGRPESFVGQDGQLRTLCVDHDHNTGKIRGLLCSRCNLCIGHAKDSIDVLTRAIVYLETYR